MIKQFFYSTSRTLGRIFAYVVLGFLIYFIISCFKVEAQDYNFTNFYLTGLSQNQGSICDSANSTNLNCSNTYGWQAYAWNNNTFQGVQAGNYSVFISFRIYYNSGYPEYNYSQLPLSIYFESVNATCDGTSTYIKEYQAYGDEDNYVQWNYTCTNLVVNRDFNSVKLYLFNSSRPVPFYRFWVFNFQLTDLVSDSDRINANNNANTQRIIDNNNQNNQNIINNQNNNTTIINNNIDDLNSDIMSDSDADITPLEDIKDLMPSNTPVTNLVAMPVTLLSAYFDNINGTCQPWTINTGSLLGNHTWTLPCINLARRLGSDVWSWNGYSLWNLIDIMGVIFMIYNIALLMINAYNDLASLDDTYALMTQHRPYRLEGK